MEHAQKIFNSLVKNDEESAFESFKSAITHKMEQAMEVKKVAVASEIFNQPIVEESTDLDEDYEQAAKMRVAVSNTKRSIKAKQNTLQAFQKQLANGKPEYRERVAKVKEQIKGLMDTLKGQEERLRSVQGSKNESTELEEAKLEKPKGSPLEIQNKLGTMIAKAKTMKGISDDEYMSWYSNLDDKTYNKWEKMVKADPQYKKAYKLGTQGGSDKPPFPKGTFAAAIWSNEYAAGAMDN